LSAGEVVSLEQPPKEKIDVPAEKLNEGHDTKTGRTSSAS